MKVIILLDNKPIYTSTDLVDWWRVVSIIYREKSIKPLTSEDLDSWRGYARIRGKSVEEILNGYNVIVWKWNEVAQDWYKQ